MAQRGGTVRSAAGQRSELLRVGHHAVARIQSARHDVVAEGQDFGIRVLAQDRSGDERGNIDAAGGRRGLGAALPVTGGRMEPDTSGQTTTRPSIFGTFSMATSMASCSASRTDAGFYGAVGGLNRGEQLVREATSGADFLRISAAGWQSGARALCLRRRRDGRRCSGSCGSSASGLRLAIDCHSARPRSSAVSIWKRNGRRDSIRHA